MNSVSNMAVVLTSDMGTTLAQLNAGNEVLRRDGSLQNMQLLLRHVIREQQIALGVRELFLCESND